MLDKLIALDKSLFVYLNGLGSETFDSFWLLITKQTSWIPLFLLLAYIIYRKMGLKQTVILLLFVAALVTITDQTANLFKHGFARLRPCNDSEINSLIRIVKSTKSFSFFSGHAANSMAVCLFVFLNLKKYFSKYFRFIFFWPLIFAYSRIYLGLHFPLDILTGYAIGATYGFLMFQVYKKAKTNYFPEE
ncbi:MAG: phosphatase PAP2 family protein [Flavobacterium sp.]